MATTKKDVVVYLKTDRSLTTGKNLYNKLVGKSLAVQNSFNRMTDTPKNRAIMHYEIGKLVGLSEREIKIYTSKPVVKKVIDLKPVELPVELSVFEKLISFDPEKADYQKELKPFAKLLSEEYKLNFEDQKKDTLILGIRDLATVEREKQLKEVPIEVKKTIKLRAQFPFLNEKECPIEYKALVADLITTYNTYTENHRLLFEKATQDELAAVAATVKDNYIENKLIWEELEHYRVNGEPLGKHEIFVKSNLQKEFAELSTEDLTKKLKNIPTNISRNKGKAKDKSRSEADRELSKELYLKQEFELELVQAELAKR